MVRMVDYGTGRKLGEQPRDGTNAERKADAGLTPARARQIDADERAKAGLHRGGEKVQPAQPVPAARGSYAADLPLATRRLPGVAIEASAVPGNCEQDIRRPAIAAGTS